MLLLIGSNEQLVRSVLEAVKKDQEVFFLESDNHDITRKDFIADVFRDVKPSTVLNCSFYNDFHEAEYWREAVYNINSFFPESLAQLCARDGAVTFPVELITGL